MQPEDMPNGEAERLADDPILKSILDELEENAMEIAVHAKIHDDETRRSTMNEIRAIRNLRQKIKEIAKGKIETIQKNVA